MKLLVIIPYFKLKYLSLALDSLAEQCDQRFNVWIGDDASPEEPLDVIRNYESLLNITYYRFSENWGARSVVAHWNRCIRASKSKWIWLFSDDDTATPNCIKSFYQALEKSGPRHDVYRFQTSVIDENGVFLRESAQNPPFESAAELAICRLSGWREFFVQSHIFSRSSFDHSGGLVELPCGLFSEDAGFSLMCRETGVATLAEGRVNWRQSRINLNAQLPELVDQKLLAFMQYVSWVDSEFGNEGFSYRRMLRRGSARWILSALPYLGGAPSARIQRKFYKFFACFAPLNFPRVWLGTWQRWR